ncbi:hypothetical protein E2C01_067886 [Portunus trituberculatus]|uniref:Uncharacterized protein n=1 Tax=Portunus trituberculatus TaxID=210409 RepID=A0A5B7HU92_PORTR|nr:hypothetical protein [Portunus trituberculatus]
MAYVSALSVSGKARLFLACISGGKGEAKWLGSGGGGGEAWARRNNGGVIGTVETLTRLRVKTEGSRLASAAVEVVLGLLPRHSLPVRRRERRSALVVVGVLYCRIYPQLSP